MKLILANQNNTSKQILTTADTHDSLRLNNTKITFEKAGLVMCNLSLLSNVFYSHKLGSIIHHLSLQLNKHIL